MGYDVAYSTMRSLRSHRFKLFEVFSWDDGSTQYKEVSSFQEPESVDCDINESNPDDLELAEMAAMGLPQAFSSTKKSTRKKKGFQSVKGSSRVNQSRYNSGSASEVNKSSYPEMSMLAQNEHVYAYDAVHAIDVDGLSLNSYQASSNFFNIQAKHKYFEDSPDSSSSGEKSEDHLMEFASLDRFLSQCIDREQPEVGTPNSFPESRPERAGIDEVPALHSSRFTPCGSVKSSGKQPAAGKSKDDSSVCYGNQTSCLGVTNLSTHESSDYTHSKYTANVADAREQYDTQNSAGSSTDEVDAYVDSLTQPKFSSFNEPKRVRTARRNQLRARLGEYNSLKPSPKNEKYWCQRISLFSRYEEGILMDEEAWYSVTPEAIAKHHASRCAGDVVIDSFAGAGGNSIQFADKCRHVLAIDIDPKKIDYALHNAKIYKLDDRIDFVNGDFFRLAPNLKADTVFLSPPWGGPDYAKVDTYDLSMLQPCDGHTLFNVAKRIARRIVMFLPRNIDLNQLVDLALSSDPPFFLEVEKNFLNGKLKAITAYFVEKA